MLVRGKRRRKVLLRVGGAGRIEYIGNGDGLGTVTTCFFEKLLEQTNTGEEGTVPVTSVSRRVPEQPVLLA